VIITQPEHGQASYVKGTGYQKSEINVINTESSQYVAKAG